MGGGVVIRLLFRKVVVLSVLRVTRDGEMDRKFLVIIAGEVDVCWW
jgi:hypothetical protein